MPEEVKELDDNLERDDLQMVTLAAEVAMLRVIAGSLRKIERDTTYTDVSKWQVAGMSDISAIAATLSTMLSKRAGLLFDAGAKDIDSWAKPLFEASGRPFRSVMGIPFSKQSVTSGASKAAKDVESMCRTSVLRIVSHDGTATPIAQAYRDCLTNAVSAMRSSGEIAYQQAYDSMVRQLASGGVRVQYESGATRELYSAVMGNIMDNYRMTMQEARDEVGRAFGADGVEVSAHGMCAEDHAPYQGRQFTNAQFQTIQDGLERPIAQGYNCRHQTFPILLGVSKQANTPEQLKKYREQSSRKVTIGDREMTAYEFTQRQRAMETSVRKLKAQKAILEAAGSDTANIDATIDATVRRYRQESKAAGVRTREDRMVAYEWK